MNPKRHKEREGTITLLVQQHNRHLKLFGGFNLTKFGILLIQEEGAYHGIRDFKAIKKIAATCEKLGFDSVWLSDHFFSYPVPSPRPFFECWTTLSALSTIIKKANLGSFLHVQLLQAALCSCEDGCDF